MKIIKSPVQLAVDERDYTLITRLNGLTYVYGHTYWLISRLDTFGEERGYHLGVRERLDRVLEPLRNELAKLNETEQAEILADWFGVTNIGVLTHETLPEFLELYQLSEDPDFIQAMHKLYTSDGYNIAKLLVLFGMDTLLELGQDVDQLEEAEKEEC